jgi:hypothetical protein
MSFFIELFNLAILFHSFYKSFIYENKASYIEFFKMGYVNYYSNIQLILHKKIPTIVQVFFACIIVWMLLVISIVHHSFFTMLPKL